MKSTILLLLSFLLFLPSGLAQQRHLIDRVVAVVNDEAITQSELDIILRPVYLQYKDKFSGDRLLQEMNEARRKLLHQLIEDRLVYQEAKELGIEASPNEIDDQMARFRENFENETELENAMRAEGLTYGALEDRLKRQAMIRQLHTREVRSHVVVSPKEIEEYYKTHPEQFSTEDQIKARSITIKKSDEARRKGIKDEAAKIRVNELREQIINGGDFGEMAKEFSQDTRAAQGGLTGWISSGTMIPVIEDVIFKMEQDEISDIIETPIGYHLFRVELIQKGTKQDFETSRDQIYDRIFAEKAKARFNEWMEDLKKNAYISIR